MHAHTHMYAHTNTRTEDVKAEGEHVGKRKPLRGNGTREGNGGRDITVEKVFERTKFHDFQTYMKKIEAI